MWGRAMGRGGVWLARRGASPGWQWQQRSVGEALPAARPGRRAARASPTCCCREALAAPPWARALPRKVLALDMPPTQPLGSCRRPGARREAGLRAWGERGSSEKAVWQPNSADELRLAAWAEAWEAPQVNQGPALHAAAISASLRDPSCVSPAPCKRGCLSPHQVRALPLLRTLPPTP